MKSLIYKTYKDRRANRSATIVDNPQYDRVISTLKELGSNVDYLHIVGSGGTLSVAYAGKERMIVTYQETRKSRKPDPDWQWGKLVDPKLSAKDGEIDTMNDGVECSEDLYKTVLREQAVQVATYFCNHDSVPRGLMWDGNMSKYS